MPERQYWDVPSSDKEIAEMLLYYEGLVQKWEAWGEAVKELSK